MVTQAVFGNADFDALVTWKHYVHFSNFDGEQINGISLT